jgi:hypothetical protein
MDADAELVTTLSGQSRVALDGAVLHLDDLAHGVNDAAKLDEAAVAGALHDGAAIGGDGGINQIAAQPRSREKVRSSSVPAIGL